LASPLHQGQDRPTCLVAASVQPSSSSVGVDSGNEGWTTARVPSRGACVGPERDACAVQASRSSLMAWSARAPPRVLRWCSVTRRCRVRRGEHEREASGRAGADCRNGASVYVASCKAHCRVRLERERTQRRLLPRAPILTAGRRLHRRSPDCARASRHCPPHVWLSEQDFRSCAR